MSQKTAIQWTDATWNPVVGCTRISAGCRNCYAHELHDMRHKAYHAGKKMPAQYAAPFTTVQTMPDRLTQPLKWKKAQRIFVNSVSDLFHKDVPFDFILRVYQVMLETDRHTFQVLTKRADRMLGFLESRDFERMAKDFRPAGHIQHGVSVENQDAADDRIHRLLSIPDWATGPRFISAEPLLGPVNLNQLPIVDGARPHSPLHFSALHETHDDCLFSAPALLDWVIVGGESGRDARPMHPAWARSLRDQCTAAGVPFFFKQWGEFLHNGEPPEWNKQTFRRIGKKAAGRLLDGQEWNEFPNPHRTESGILKEE